MFNDRKSPELRRFGVMVGGILAIIAIVPVLFRGDQPRGWVGFIAGTLIILGLAAPKVLGPLYRLWMWLGRGLGWFNTRVLLGLVYFLIMTPTGAVMRLASWDPLDRRLRDRSSYWVERKQNPDPRGSMERRF